MRPDGYSPRIGRLRRERKQPKFLAASLTDSPAHLRDGVCGAAKAKPKARRSVTSKLQRLNAGSGGAPADASSVSEAN